MRRGQSSNAIPCQRFEAEDQLGAWTPRYSRAIIRRNRDAGTLRNLRGRSHCHVRDKPYLSPF